MREWMTIEDLSDYLQIPSSKIRFLIKENKIPYHDKLGSPRFFKPDIDEWMRTPINEGQKTTNDESVYLYRGTPVKEFKLTASKVLIGKNALNKLPDFILEAVKASKEQNRPFLYRREFEPLIDNFNDYLRVSCQLGLIDNRPGEEREKHYYPTNYSEKIYIENNTEKTKKIILDSILDIVKQKMETIPQQRHSILLLWYYLKIRAKGKIPEESHFNLGGENNYYPTIRLNFAKSLFHFLIGEDESREEAFLGKLNKYM